MRVEVYKHNSIIGADVNKVTLQDERYIQVCLGRLYKKELLRRDMFYGVDIDYYAEKVNISKKQAYKELREIADSLQEAKVTIPQEDSDKIQVNWIYAILYNDEKYTLSVKWNEYVIPFISGFTKGNYTTVDESVVTIKSLNCLRLYEICKRDGYKKKFELSFLELQKLLGVSYKLYADFRVKLLQPGIEIINKTTDINVKITPLKTGKKVDRFLFEVEKKL